MPSPPTFLCLFTLATCAACTTLIPGVSPHDIRRDAASLEKSRCNPTSPDPRLYGVPVIEKVSPLYQYVIGGPNDREARLGGAEIELRPLPGVTAELLERTLVCRSAQLTLGHAEPLANEPYFLPDGWVKVDVRSGGGSFIVRLSGEDDEHGREILRRARAYAAGVLTEVSAVRAP